MRRSLRQLKINQPKAEPHSSRDESPSKRRKLHPVKGSNAELTRGSREISSNGVGKEKSSFVKTEPLWGPDEKVVEISSGVKPSYAHPEKLKTEKKGFDTDPGSFDKSPKADENEDPTDFKKLRKTRADSPTKTEVKDESNDETKPDVTRSDADGSDLEEESFSYAQIREKNLRANEQFLADLRMEEAKEMLQASALKRKKPTQRGLKIKSEKEILPRRHSLRIKRIDPLGNQLPEPEPVVEDFEPSRLPPGPVGMKECFYSKHEADVEEHLKSFKALMKGVTKVVDVKVPADFNSSLTKMTISEEGVAKVVPGRVFSLAWHPAASPQIAIAGDKYGTVGLWNVLSKDEDQLVAAFKPHTKPVGCLKVPFAAQNKLYSCSYDGTLRCGDFEKGIFTEVLSVPETDDDLLRNFDFFNGDKTMLVSHFRGLVSLVDVRTPQTKAEQVYTVSHKSLRTVSIHPIRQDYFITTGTDTNISLWDMRKMAPKSPKPLQVLDQHTKSIASAFFSPQGHKIVSSSADDTILVHDFPSSGTEIKLSKRIRHNNCTGRWLTNFQPTWHPTVPDTFVVGSMARPREIQVFDATKGMVVHSLRSEDNLGSVCSLNIFHPRHPNSLVGANSSGRLHFFK